MKQFEVVLYDKQETLSDYDSKVRRFIKKNAFQYVIAKHLAYESVEYQNEAHTHYYVSLHNSWSLADLSKSIGIPENCIQKIRKQWLTAILYARHINQKYKPLIPMSCVETNIPDYESTCDKALKKGSTSVENRKFVPECVVRYANGEISYTKMREMLDYETFNKYYLDIQRAKTYRNKFGVKRDMKVLYITGEAGSGKTTLAKFLGDNLGYDIFICGSGADPFDGYDNQECVILDDLRGDVFTKAELFKLLDNNTNSSVKSRYFNKVITQCKLLIITSIKSPRELYDWSSGEDEPFNQFARRLLYCYLVIPTNDKEEIREMHMPEKSPLYGPLSMQRAPFTMEFVYACMNIVKTAPVGFMDLLRDVQNKARKKIETDKPAD